MGEVSTPQDLEFESLKFQARSSLNVKRSRVQAFRNDSLTPVRVRESRSLKRDEFESLTAPSLRVSRVGTFGVRKFERVKL